MVIITEARAHTRQKRDIAHTILFLAKRSARKRARELEGRIEKRQ